VPGGVACGDVTGDAVTAAAGTNRTPQFVQNRFAGRFKVPHDGQTAEADKRPPLPEIGPLGS